VEKSFNMSAQPLFTGAAAGYPYDAKLEMRFRCVSRFEEEYSLSEKDGDHLLIPRELCPMGAKDKRVPGIPVDIVSAVVPRTDEQTRVMSEGLAFLKAGQSGIIEAATGVGKTVIAADLIAKIGRKTLVVVHKDDLMQNWKSELVRHTNLKPSDIGTIQGDTFDVKGKKVVVGMIHSLAKKDRYPTFMKREFGLVVFDEVHVCGAETFSKVAGLFYAKLRLGLSATPDRKDGKEILFKAHIGPVRIQSQLANWTPKVTFVSSGWTCPSIPHSPGKCGHILSRMGKDQARNAKVVKLGAHCYRAGRTTVVFSDLAVEKHLGHLKRGLIGAGVPADEIAYYVGGMTAKQRDQAAGKKILLATYQMMSI